MSAQALAWVARLATASVDAAATAAEVSLVTEAGKTGGRLGKELGHGVEHLMGLDEGSIGHVDFGDVKRSDRLEAGNRRPIRRGRRPVEIEDPLLVDWRPEGTWPEAKVPAVPPPKHRKRKAPVGVVAPVGVPIPKRPRTSNENRSGGTLGVPSGRVRGEVTNTSESAPRYTRTTQSGIFGGGELVFFPERRRPRATKAKPRMAHRKYTTARPTKKRKTSYVVSNVPQKNFGPTGRSLNYRTGGFTGIEKKFLDTELTMTNIGATWTRMDPTTLLCLNATVQGDTESAREGRHCRLLSLTMHFTIRLLPDASLSVVGNGEVVRVVVFVDHQTNGAQETATDVMTEPGVGSITDGFRNLQHVTRFTVLMDKRFPLNPDMAANNAADATISLPSLQRTLNLYKDLALDVHHDGSTAVIASITDVSLHVIAIATSANQTALSYVSRIRFVG